MSDELARQVDEVEVTDQQRDELCTLLTADPYRGHVKACRQANIAGTAGQLRQWFDTDPAVQEHLDAARNEYLKGKRLDIDTLLGKVSAIVHNDESQSQWRAVDWAFATLHRMGARQSVQVEHTGADGGPIQIEDRSASLADVARVLEAVGALAELSGGTPRAALPAAADVLAKPREG